MESAQQRNKKRTKAGVLVSEITFEDLQSAFHLPTERACVKLGVGLTILKRLCRKHGISRWPYRSLLKAGKAERLPNSPSTSLPLPSPRALAPAAPCSSPSCDAPHSAYMMASTSSSSLANQGLSGGEDSIPLAAAAAAAAGAVHAGKPHLPPFPRANSFDGLGAAAEAAQPAAAASVPPPTEFFQAAEAAARAVEHPQAQPAQPGSDLSLLLSAIDACESEEAAPSSSGTTWAMDSLSLAPYTPHAGASTPAGPGPQRRAFTHGARSAFRLVTPAPEARATASDAGDDVDATLEAKRAELQRRLRMLQDMQAKVAALVPSSPLPDAADSLLRSVCSAEVAAEEQRMQLAEKLVLARAALQKRIARNRAALAATTSRFAPYTAAMPSLQMDTDGPSATSSLPAAHSGVDSPPSPAYHDALASARTLLARYHV